MSDLTAEEQQQGINFERLDNAITEAVARPEGFDFGTFFSQTPCGTTACLGGGIAQQAGWKPIWGTGPFPDSASDVERDGEVRAAMDVAAELIGATETQAYSLFVFGGSLNGAIRIRNQWAREAGIPERTWGEQ